MFAPKLHSTAPAAARRAAQYTTSRLSWAIAGSTRSYSCLASAPLIAHRNELGNGPTTRNAVPTKRHFSSTPSTQLKDIFPPPKEAPHIHKTDAAWPHPGYTYDQMLENIRYEHRAPKDFSDRVALTIMRVLRRGTDFCTGYHHDVETPAKVGDKNAVATTKPYRMSERKWLIRIVFLESVAGVPGMVAGMLRHLRSLRSLKRDNGWIETLLEEAYNERMHLLTFLKIAEPGIFMRAMILGAQGVLFNSLFISYLISPRTVHRFVGYLEEEAVLTYTLCIQDLEAGKLPKWEEVRTLPDGKKEIVTALQAPDIAIDYWKMPEGKRTMKDLLLYVRADEAKHREVNHTLSNLKQGDDPNPFNSTYEDSDTKPRPGKGIEHMRGVGWERKDVL